METAMNAFAAAKPQRRTPPAPVSPNHNEDTMNAYAAPAPGKPTRKALTPSPSLPEVMPPSPPRRRSVPTPGLAAQMAEEGLRRKEPIMPPSWPITGSLTVFMAAVDVKGLSQKAAINPGKFSSPEEIEEWVLDNCKGHRYRLLSVSGFAPDGRNLTVLYAPDAQDPLVQELMRDIRAINHACNTAGAK